MNDSITDKITFSAAVLGILFTVQSIDSSGTLLAFVIYGKTFSLKGLYYLVAAFMGLSVYCYGLFFMVSPFRKFFQRTGDLFYLAAFGTPPAYLVLCGLVRVADYASEHGKAELEWPYVVSVLISIASAIATMSLHRNVIRSLAIRKDYSRLDGDVADTLNRASDLLRQGHNDLAVLDAFRTVEHALSVTLQRRGQDVATAKGRDILDLARKEGILSDDLFKSATYLARLRNEAVHRVKPIAISDAREAMRIADHLLVAILSAPERDG